MNKHLSPQELKDVEAKHPVHNLMSRADKLDRLAKLVAKRVNYVALFDRVEYMSQKTKEHTIVAGSIFDLAMQDPVFRAAGLQGSTIAHGQRFFEISDEELHDLSCNCGGQISQAEMAKRLLSMKSPSTRYLTPIAVFAVGAATWAITAAVAIQAFA